MDLRAKIRQTLPWLLQKRTLWIALAMVLLYPPLWLAWTQPWQYQPQVPTGPLPEQLAQRPAYPLPPEIQAAKDEGMRLWGQTLSLVATLCEPVHPETGAATPKRVKISVISPDARIFSISARNAGTY